MCAHAHDFMHASAHTNTHSLSLSLYPKKCATLAINFVYYNILRWIHTYLGWGSILWMDPQYIQPDNYRLDCGWLLRNVHLVHMFLGTGPHISGSHMLCSGDILSSQHTLVDNLGDCLCKWVGMSILLVHSHSDTDCLVHMGMVHRDLLVLVLQLKKK
jgi:hypothetical protein